MDKTTKLLLIVGIVGVGAFLLITGKMPHRTPSATAGRVPQPTPPRGNTEANMWSTITSGVNSITKALSGRSSGGSAAAGGGQAGGFMGYGGYDVTENAVGDTDVVGNQLIDDTGSAVDYGPW